eukprot:scaffold39146_cov181-Skeletonema_marinoi.AAC.2
MKCQILTATELIRYTVNTESHLINRRPGAREKRESGCLQSSAARGSEPTSYFIEQTTINSLPIIGCEGPDHAIARHTANLQFLIDQSERLSIRKV